MSVTRERQHRNVTPRRDPESKVLRLELLDLLNLFAPLASPDVGEIPLEIAEVGSCRH